MFKRLNLFILGLRLDYENAMLDQCERQYIAAISDRAAHKVRRDALCKRFCEVWHEKRK